MDENADSIQNEEETVLKYCNFCNKKAEFECSNCL